MLAATGSTQAAAVQPVLGDDEDAETRLASLNQEVQERQEAIGAGGISQPKHAVCFVNNITYKRVGGQQFTAQCMFCKAAITSTGANRVLEHFAVKCVLIPRAMKDSFVAIRESADQKRKVKQEHVALVKEEQDG